VALVTPAKFADYLIGLLIAGTGFAVAHYVFHRHD